MDVITDRVKLASEMKKEI